MFRHKKDAHGERVRCPHCPFTAPRSRQYRLKAHVRQQHPDGEAANGQRQSKGTSEEVAPSVKKQSHEEESAGDSLPSRKRPRSGSPSERAWRRSPTRERRRSPTSERVIVFGTGSPSSPAPSPKTSFMEGSSPTTPQMETRTSTPERDSSLTSAAGSDITRNVSHDSCLPTRGRGHPHTIRRRRTPATSSIHSTQKRPIREKLERCILGGAPHQDAGPHSRIASTNHIDRRAALVPGGDCRATGWHPLPTSVIPGSPCPGGHHRNRGRHNPVFLREAGVLHPVVSSEWSYGLDGHSGQFLVLCFE